MARNKTCVIKGKFQPGREPRGERGGGGGGRQPYREESVMGNLRQPNLDLESFFVADLNSRSIDQSNYNSSSSLSSSFISQIYPLVNRNKNLMYVQQCVTSFIIPQQGF